MALVARDSRSRVGIEWYDSEQEADQVAAAQHQRMLVEPWFAQAVRDANIGFVQCGRRPALDREVDGQQQFAVVTP